MGEGPPGGDGMEIQRTLRSDCALVPRGGIVKLFPDRKKLPTQAAGLVPVREWKWNFLWFKGGKMMFEGDDVELKVPKRR